MFEDDVPQIGVVADEIEVGPDHGADPRFNVAPGFELHQRVIQGIEGLAVEMED